MPASVSDADRALARWQPARHAAGARRSVPRAGRADRDLAGAEPRVRHLLDRLALGRADALRRGHLRAATCCATPSYTLSEAVGRLPHRRHCPRPRCRSACGACRSSPRSSIRSWSAATARPSSRSRRCSSCGSASASNPRSRWSPITVFFIVYFSALAGVRALDTKLVQMAQVAGASERDVARHIVFPGAVPYIFTGLRIAMPYSIGGAVIAELISANRGLGYLVQLGAMNFDTTGVFVALVADHLHRVPRQLERQRARAAAAALASAGRRHACRRGPDAWRRCSKSATSRKRFAGARRARAVAVGDPGPELLGRATASSSPSSARRAPARPRCST